MIRSFKNSGTEDIYNGVNSKSARNLLPQNLLKIAYRKLDQLDSVEALHDLRIPPGNQFEASSVIGKGSIASASIGSITSVFRGLNQGQAM